jgi:uncharacterized protein YhaN
MRIKRLELKAFGPFTNRTLEFDSREPGLHIIFGRNEAGKSSSLRALKALLYGFQHETPDNFLHSYDQLLVGGCLQGENGEEVCFQRRKKRLNDVLDQEGNPLDLEVAAPFLHGIKPEIFESLYGITHEVLVRGGEEILAQKGEVGQALFAAGAGISSLREVIDQLEKEAAELFKPAGQRPAINQAINTFKELKKVRKESSLSSREWKNHQDNLEKAEAERARLEGNRAEKSRELRRLERLAKALPELAGLDILQEQRQALGEVTLLPADFPEQHRQAEQEVREVTLQIGKDAGRLAILENQRHNISFNRDILRQAEMVDDFYQRRSQYLTGRKDRDKLEGLRIGCRREAAALLQQIRPELSLDEVESLRPLLNRKSTVQALSSHYEALDLQLTRMRKLRQETEKDLRQTEAALAGRQELKEVRGLEQAVILARKAGEIDAQLLGKKGETEEERKGCRAELKRLGLWQGDFSTLLEISFPLPETVKGFEKGFTGLAESRREQEKEYTQLHREAQSAAAEISMLEYAGTVPSEKELKQARERREQGWQLLRRQWLGREDIEAESLGYDPEAPLPEAYEKEVSRADLVADRLRREADRVAKGAELRSRIETSGSALAENRRRLELLNRQGEELDASWQAVWKSQTLTPLSPREMLGWLTEIDKLRFKVGEIFKKEGQIGKENLKRREVRKMLLRELNSLDQTDEFPGEELSPVLVAAESLLEKITGEKIQRDKLTEKKEKALRAFERAEEDLQEALDRLGRWRENWHQALAGLGSGEQISPLEALALFEALQSCLTKVKEAEDLKKRIAGIDRDTDLLAREVKAFLTDHAPGLLTVPVEQAIVQLQELLKEARQQNTRDTNLGEEIERLRQSVQDAEKTRESAAAQMKALLRTARCEQPEELAAVIRRSADHDRLQKEISAAETVLARIAEGQPIEELRSQAAAINPDELPERLEALRRTVDEELNPAINRASQVIGEETIKLAAMDGSARAAEAAEAMEHELASIRRLADRYLRIKLAARILQQEIERYRTEHQDPVLKIASRYFAELTVNSFAGLRTDVDDKGEPVLVGLRPGDVRVPVEGMSSGTRDQLYLSLRLATLEWRLQSHEPIPFIVDDILINFDDDRSGATLKVLADLAAGNQVILFTHHRQIVDQARQVAGKGAVHVHELAE